MKKGHIVIYCVNYGPGIFKRTYVKLRRNIFNRTNINTIILPVLSSENERKISISSKMSLDQKGCNYEVFSGCDLHKNLRLGHNLQRSTTFVPYKPNYTTHNASAAELLL
jgi:hypothetical protein